MIKNTNHMMGKWNTITIKKCMLNIIKKKIPPQMEEIQHWLQNTWQFKNAKRVSHIGPRKLILPLLKRSGGRGTKKQGKKERGEETEPLSPQISSNDLVPRNQATYSNEYASDKPKKQKYKKDSLFSLFSTFLTTAPPQFYSYIVFIYLFLKVYLLIIREGGCGEGGEREREISVCCSTY